MKAKISFLILHTVILNSFFETSNALDARDVVFMILSQSNEHHVQLAQEIKTDINIQAQELNMEPPVTHLSHVDFPHVGGWTIIPLIPGLAARHGPNSSFVFFLEDRTRVRLKALLELLNNYDDKSDTFVGYALQDNEPSIIHHFAFYEDPQSFKYPNAASGFAISTRLLLSLSEKIKKGHTRSDFSIDSTHELALLLWDDDKGVTLKHEPGFCISKEQACATYPQRIKQCEKVVPLESIYFAVKTCQKYHKDRVPVVKETWAKHATLIKFFSDIQDEGIPTVNLNVPNTENGHCEKTFGIIKYVANEIKNKPSVKWVFIADDDTILSVSGLQLLLSCYKSEEAISLGERYGYGVLSPKGYNYITGGGGTVLSRTLLQLLAKPHSCKCPSASTPDDMYLGICLRQLGANIVHSPLFHQARPADYAPAYLQSHKAVSFHKHWMVDPVKVYRTWFAEADAAISSSIQHIEL